MLKKTIEYVDYEGEKRVEDFYFNLSQAEVTQWMMQPGNYTLDKVLLTLVKAKNGRRMMEVIEDLILRSYGEKSFDGKRFIKSEEMREEFKQTEAYSNLFMELITDDTKAADFILGIFPKDLSDKIRTSMNDQSQMIPEELRGYLPTNSEKNP